MTMAIGELRRVNKTFAFTVQLHGQAKPIEVVCDNKAVAHRRIRALRASDSAWAETVLSPAPRFGLPLAPGLKSFSKRLA